MTRLKRFLYFSILLTLFFLFFIGGPDYLSQRSYKSFWNLGHILFFSLLPLLFTFSRRISNNDRLQCLLALAIPVILGIIIELLQYGLQRIPDPGDLFRNLIGGLAGIFFLLPARKAISENMRRIGQIGVIVLVGFQVYPVIISFADEYMARKQFPDLSSFETPYEINRWSGDADFTVDSDIKKTGKAALRVHFTTDQYSGVGLRYFPNNWEGFRYFQFSVFNPSFENISLTCRIHDKKHTEQDQRYEDRFNRTFSIPRGWHTIAVSLKDIEQAPKGRLMNMREIRNVHFFTIRLPNRRVVYFDDLKLLVP